MESATQSIVSKLGQLVVEEFQDIRGVGDKIVLLTDELATMNAVLLMISEADESAVDHLVRQWEKQVRELAYDTEDCADIYRLRVNRPIPIPDNKLLTYVLNWPKYKLKKLRLRRNLAADIKALLARTYAVSERRARYHIDRTTLPRSPWFAPVSALMASASAHAQLRHAGDSPGHQLVGITEQANTLAERIKEIRDDADKSIKVFSIVGFGGLGKTTLAVELCRRLEADFQRQALVSVSQAFDGGKDMKELLARLLPQIVKPKEDDEQKHLAEEGASTGRNDANELKMDKMDVEELSTKLSELLAEKRYLIVIDDVWSLPAWEAILIRLPENNCGSRIIVTTRMETVAKASSISEDFVHHMKPLELQASEKLFVNIVFGTTDTCPHRRIQRGGRCPHELHGSPPEPPQEISSMEEEEEEEEGGGRRREERRKEEEEEVEAPLHQEPRSAPACPDGLRYTMSKILKKCGGLPLAIVKIASILSTYNSVESEEMWTRVSNSIGSMEHPTLEGMRQVITLSYGYLPHHLKACMLYLSTFPEDYVIAKDRLLYRWIAEGLVAEKRGLTLFDVAEEYFNELISRNMIQAEELPKAEDWNYMSNLKKINACRVHDMMLEVMVSKSQEANFVCLVGRQYGGGLIRGKVRRLSVHGNVECEEEHSSSPNKKKKKVVEQRHCVRHGGIEAMKVQHVRSLTTFEVEEGLCKLLDRLGEFRLLRVLDLEGCKALKDKHMRDVCQLYLLRFLSLRRTPISVMPSEIGDLECLESLDVQDTRIGRNMPPTVTKLSKLERLRMDDWVLPQGLGNMKALREVYFARLNIHNVQVADEIGELQQLQVLCMKFDNSWVPAKDRREPSKEFLHALASSLSKTYALRTLHLRVHNHSMDFLLSVSSPPPLLRSLAMAGRISRFPSWISSLKHLAEFSLRFTNLAASDELLDPLCELPNLQSLRLGYGSCRGPKLVARTKHKFPALRILELKHVSAFKQVKFKKGSMVKLEALVMTFSSRDEEMSIVGIDNLKNLKEVKLRGREDSRALKRALQELQEGNQNRPKPNQIKVVVEYY